MPDFAHAPIKRHQTLQPLSRDHYQGLVQSQHLMRAADSDAVARRKALAEFLDVWEQQIEPHFNDEERLLAGLASDAQYERLTEEHHRLREMAVEARGHRSRVDPGAEWIRDLGQYLHRHIRWEERELFTAIESSSAGKLDSLSPEADQIEASRPRGRGRY